MEEQVTALPTAVLLYDAHGDAMFALATVLLCDREAAAAVVVEVIRTGALELARGSEVARSDLALWVLAASRQVRRRRDGPTGTCSTAEEGVPAPLLDLSFRERAALGLTLFARPDREWVARTLSLPPSSVAATLHDSLSSLASGGER